MPVGPEHVRLNNHHRATLAKIFQHPTSRNIEWLDVLSLMEAMATIDESHDGKYIVTLGRSETFDRSTIKASTSKLAL
ncbi:MAG: hypothetical protein ACYCPT_11280 [Acidimicrobiales bacterium]